MRRILFCLPMLATLPAYAEIRDAGEVDKAGMATIWRQVVGGDDGLAVNAVLVGELAAKIRETTGSPGPYKATVSRVKKYREPGCARIRIAYVFPAARTVDGGRRDADISYEQNFCLDGHIPRETIDLNAVPNNKGDI
ncbi:hypothetical protein [Candidatus Ferrigenium straubiae]|jgi:hypothetical protein|uniref:hypothetical protein n=1 Tax=Candidatus Ferrigenium straubiae TaxID=2919506 RepID=UPI003F4AB739